MKTRPIYFILIICNLLVLSSVFIPPSHYVNSINNPFTPSFDYTSFFTDISVFIVTGVLTVLAIKASQWANSNNKWKNDREAFELNQANTNANLANAIKLLVDDLKVTKEKMSSEINEIQADFHALNTKVTLHDERIENIRDKFKK